MLQQHDDSGADAPQALATTLREVADVLEAEQPLSAPAWVVRAEIDAQLRRSGLDAADARAVRHDVAATARAAPGADAPASPASICAWLAVLARNRGIDHQRRMLRHCASFETSRGALGASLVHPPLDAASGPGGVSARLGGTRAALAVGIGVALAGGGGGLALAYLAR